MPWAAPRVKRCKQTPSAWIRRGFLGSIVTYCIEMANLESGREVEANLGPAPCGIDELEVAAVQAGDALGQCESEADSAGSLADESLSKALSEERGPAGAVIPNRDRPSTVRSSERPIDRHDDRFRDEMADRPLGLGGVAQQVANRPVDQQSIRLQKHGLPGRLGDRDPQGGILGRPL